LKAIQAVSKMKMLANGDDKDGRTGEIDSGAGVSMG
jgi:hypothetical protein